MIVCDSDKCGKAGLNILKLGERDFAWCGNVECLSGVFSKARALLLPVAKSVRITLDQQNPPGDEHE